MYYIQTLHHHKVLHTNNLNKAVRYAKHLIATDHSDNILISADWAEIYKANRNRHEDKPILTI